MINLDKDYNPRENVSNYKNLLLKSYERAKLATKKMHHHKNVSYGAGKLQKLDIYYKNNKCLKPIHIFLHGGYWRALDKNYHSHMALPFYNEDIIFFNVNYDLCPQVKLSDIKVQIIEAIVWIYKNSEKYDGDNQYITLSGHSAGAHLISLMLGIKWELYNIPKHVFHGAFLVSGVFDTDLVLKLKVNKEIQLTKKEAKKNNPFYIIPTLNIPIILSYGSLEPVLWKMQTVKFCDFLKNNKFDTLILESKNDNHFTLIDTLANKEAPLVKKMINLINKMIS